MQNREAQRRFRARNQKHIDGLQKELNDLRTENRKLLEEHKQKVEEVSRLQEKINDMNRKMKDAKETETKFDCDMPPIRCQCWAHNVNRALALFRPTEIRCCIQSTANNNNEEDNDRRHSEQHSFGSCARDREQDRGRVVYG